MKMDRGVYFQRVKMDRGSIFNGGPFSISHRHNGRQVQQYTSAVLRLECSLDCLSAPTLWRYDVAV